MKVKLLISWWKHSSPAEDHFLRSLTDLSQAYPKVDLQVVSISLLSVKFYVLYKVLFSMCLLLVGKQYVIIRRSEGILVARPYVTLTRFICVLVIDFFSYFSELLKVSL